MNKILFTLIIFSFFSCSTSVTIKPNKCNARLVMFPQTFDINDFKSIEITKKGVGNIEFFLHEELREKNLNCEQMSELFYSVRTRSFDILLGLIPSFSSRTITIWYR